MTGAQKDDMVLDVKNLQTVFFTNSGLFRAVDDLSFSVRRGETLAIVGESGCGKSVTALSVMRLVPDPPGRVVGGSVTLEGTDLLGLAEAEMRKIAATALDDFQEPMNSLKPVMRIGDQITECSPAPGMTSKEAWPRRSRCCASSGSRTGAARDEIRIISGGMRQARDDRDGLGVRRHCDRGRTDNRST